MSGALSGVRVIDFGQYIAGPLTGMLLADQGAEVLKVDPPGGPAWNTPANATWNRGKRSVVLDLKDEAGRNRARELVRHADVVIENFRPGVMERLGLGSGEMTAANTALIYCSLPGFAADDPRSAIRAWEGVVGAATGCYRSRLGGDRPVYTAIPVPSSFAAFQAATSIVMALIARDRDGPGQRIEVPLFDGMFTAIGVGGLRLHDRPTPPSPGAASPWTRQFLCKDGRWIQFHAINQNFEAFLKEAGATAWARDPDAPQRMVELFATRTAQEWEDFAEALGTECVICRTSAEWMETRQARESGAVVEIDHPNWGRMLQPGLAARLSRTPGAPGTAERAETAEGWAASSAPANLGAGPLAATSPQAALAGVTVLDLSIFLAGPTSGRTLAEFGAAVVKIDNPNREEALIFQLDGNRGKRSIVLDLKDEDGLRVFWKLVNRADVVIQNFRKGVAERLGIGYEQVRARKPGIVYASMNTYGRSGPWAGRPGHEQLAQAATGMQVRSGGEGRPAAQPFALCDYGTGLLGAFGIALALFHRVRTGEGQQVESALTYTATLLQSPFMLAYEGKQWDEPAGQQSLGSGPLHRAYQAQDGWLFLGARRADLDALGGISGLAGVEALPESALEAELARFFEGRPVRECVDLLLSAGVAAQPVVSDLRHLMDNAWVVAHGLSLTREHDEMGPITTTGPAPRLSRTPVVPGRPAPRPGGDASAIIEEIGLPRDAGGLRPDSSGQV